MDMNDRARLRHHRRRLGRAGVRVPRRAVSTHVAEITRPLWPAIVHVHDALPRDPRTSAERVALGQVVVEHRGQQIMRGADRVHVAREVEVDVPIGAMRVGRPRPATFARTRPSDGSRIATIERLPSRRSPSASRSSRGLSLARGVGVIAVTRNERARLAARPPRSITSTGSSPCSSIRLEVAPVQPERLADRLDRRSFTARAMSMSCFPIPRSS